MRSIRTLTRAALLTLGLLAAGGAVPMPANAGTVLPAPAGVTATRVPASVKDFVVSWKPVVGALDHYNVSVSYAGQFPAGSAINAKHRLIVVVQGDTIWASVDGVEMFRVASLKAAAVASPCKYPLPTGTRIGFRTWNTSPATFENTTLR